MKRNAKQSSRGSSSGRGSRLRLTLLLATVAAFLLVPAAQAFAAGNAVVNITGTGSGEVSSVGGAGAGFENLYEGEPPIECSWVSPGPATGECEDETPEEELFLRAKAAPGSVFTGYTVEAGTATYGTELCSSTGGAPSGLEEAYAEFLEFELGVQYPCLLQTTGGFGEVTATFNKAKPAGPTNRRLLTVTKSGTGAGTVKSKPKGIACGATCSKAEASLYKNTKVALTPTAATGSSFTEWTGDCTGAGACEVTMSEAKSVGAVFGGTAKAIANPKTLTLSKVDNGFETGAGTVKASGLACEADCTSTDVSYTGGVTEPKVKAAATVTLVATKAAGSVFSGWTGCDSETEGKCIVLTSSAKAVTAEFTALPKNTLTLTKSGAGAVKGKPKGISCANTCSSAIASLPSDTTIVLTEKAATGSAFTGWTGDCSGAGETCTVSMSAAKAVTATFTAAVKPLVNPQTLTLTKAGSGYGTVKASGLTCEVACTSTAAAYYGGVTEPKPKAATTVTLAATSAPGSGTVAWSGCDSETEGKCVVSMSAAKEVTATFNELE